MKKQIELVRVCVRESNLLKMLRLYKFTGLCVAATFSI